MENLNLDGLTDEEVLELKKRIEKIRILESQNLSLGFDKCFTKGYTSSLPSHRRQNYFCKVTYSGIVLAERTIPDYTKPSTMIIDAFSGQSYIYAESSFKEDFDEYCSYTFKKSDHSFITISSLKDLLLIKGITDNLFYTENELLELYNRLTKDFKYTFMDKVSDCRYDEIEVFPTVYERNPESGIITPKLEHDSFRKIKKICVGI